MINKRDLVIKLRRMSMELTMYDIYLRTIYFKSFGRCRSFIEEHFTGVEETVDIIIDHLEEMDEEMIEHAWKVLVCGEEIDRSGKGIHRVAKETSLKLYKTHLEHMFSLSNELIR